MTERREYRTAGDTLIVLTHGDRGIHLSVVGVEIGIDEGTARELADDLHRFADRRGSATAQSASGYLADPDIDARVFADRTHDVVAAFVGPGGARLRCMSCGLLGMRRYQDHEIACSYAKMVSGVIIASRPKCERIAP